MNKSDFKQKFDELVTSAENIMITTHVRPDADAISSAVATAKYISSLGKSAQIKISGEETDVWDWVAGASEILWVEDALVEANSHDLAIFLDGSEYSRFGEAETGLREDLTKICIDHHPGEPDKFDLLFQEPKYSATAQMVLDLLFTHYVEQETAHALLVGILGDTGGLRFVSPERAFVLEDVKYLVETAGVDIQTITNKFDTMSEEVLEIMKILITNIVNVELPGLPPLTYSCLPVSEAEKHNQADVKNATGSFMFNFIRKVEGHPWGFILRPDNDKNFSVSFRALPDSVNVRELAIQFDGGGHVLAAGGELHFDEPKTSEEVCEIILAKIVEVKNKIII